MVDERHKLPAGWEGRSRTSGLLCDRFDEGEVPGRCGRKQKCLMMMMHDLQSWNNVKRL